jgi:hypothetical protein
MYYFYNLKNIVTKSNQFHPHHLGQYILQADQYFLISLKPLEIV